MPSDRRRDSYERLACTLAFYIEGMWVKLDAHEYVRAIRVSLPSAGCWRGSVSLFDATGSVLETLISRIAPTTPIRLTFGALNAAGGLDAPSYVGTITKPSFHAAYEGFSVTYEFVGYAGAAWSVDGPLKDGERFARGEKCVDAFMRIAAYAGWDKIGTGRLIVEPTDHVIDTAFCWPTSPRTSAIAMAHRLAQSTQKNGNVYEFAITPRGGGTIIFATRDYAAAKARAMVGSASREATHEYVYARDPMGEVIDVQIDDGSLTAALLGASNSEVKGTDATSGDQIVVATRDDAGLAGNAPSPATSRSTAAHVPTVPVYNDKIAVRLPDAFGSEFAARQAAAWYNRVQKSTVRGNIAVRGTHDLCPLDTMKLTFATAASRGNHFLSNVYTLLSVEHSFDQSGWTTSAEFFTSVVPIDHPTKTSKTITSLASDAGLAGQR